MEIISRTEWGAIHDNGSGFRRLPATEVWLHHSVTLAPDLLPPFTDDYKAIRTLESIGESRFGKGISYTRLFTPAGLIFEGHSIDRVGTHTANHNTVACGYCLVGNYETTKPTDKQLRAVAWCLQHDKQRGWITAAKLNGGHKDLKQTACPGELAYREIPNINRLAAGLPITDNPVEEQDMNWEQDRRQYNADRILTAMLNNEDTVTDIQPFWSGWTSSNVGQPPAKVSIKNPFFERIRNIETAVENLTISGIDLDTLAEKVTDRLLSRLNLKQVD